MKVTIQTERDYTEIETKSPVKLFEGEWPMHCRLPAIGESMDVWDGWCSEEVKNVHFMVEGQSILITLKARPCEDYYKEAVKRGVPQYSNVDESYGDA